jgi:hypothetical protein
MRTHYDADVRTTVDLPDDLDRIARAIARDTKQSLGDTIAMLIRRGLGGRAMRVDRNPRNGLPVVHLGRPVTSDDVRSLDDDA